MSVSMPAPMCDGPCCCVIPNCHFRWTAALGTRAIRMHPMCEVAIDRLRRTGKPQPTAVLISATPRTVTAGKWIWSHWICHRKTAVWCIAANPPAALRIPMVCYWIVWQSSRSCCFRHHLYSRVARITAVIYLCLDSMSQWEPQCQRQHQQPQSTRPELLILLLQVAILAA